MNESVANDGDMKNLKERLAVILSETIFDFEYTEIRGDGKRTPVSKPGLSAAGLAENYNGQRRRMGSKRAEVRATGGHDVAIDRGTAACLWVFHRSVF